MKWGLSILALCALLAATAPEGGAAELNLRCFLNIGYS